MTTTPLKRGPVTIWGGLVFHRARPALSPAMCRILDWLADEAFAEAIASCI